MNYAAAKIAGDYVDALKIAFDATANLNSAFRIFSDQNLILSLSDYWIEPYSKLVQDCIGEELMEWVDWWIFEGNFGQNDLEFFVDEDAYNVEGMTFSDFFYILTYED